MSTIEIPREFEPRVLAEAQARNEDPDATIRRILNAYYEEDVADERDVLAAE